MNNLGNMFEKWSRGKDMRHMTTTPGLPKIRVMALQCFREYYRNSVKQPEGVNGVSQLYCSLSLRLYPRFSTASFDTLLSMASVRHVWFQWNDFFLYLGNNKQQLYKSRFHLLISPGKCVHQSLALCHEMEMGCRERERNSASE